MVMVVTVVVALHIGAHDTSRVAQRAVAYRSVRGVSETDIIPHLTTVRGGASSVGRVGPGRHLGIRGSRQARPGGFVSHRSG